MRIACFLGQIWYIVTQHQMSTKLMGEISKISKILNFCNKTEKLILKCNKLKITREAITICLFQYFENNFLWKVSLKILNSGKILKTFTHESLTKPIKWPVCQLKTQFSLGINGPSPVITLHPTSSQGIQVFMQKALPLIKLGACPG